MSTADRDKEEVDIKLSFFVFEELYVTALLPVVGSPEQQNTK